MSYLPLDGRPRTRGVGWASTGWPDVPPYHKPLSNHGLKGLHNHDGVYCTLCRPSFHLGLESSWRVEYVGHKIVGKTLYDPNHFQNINMERTRDSVSIK